MIVISPENPRENPGWLDKTVQALDSLLELGERIGILLAVGIVAFVVYQLFFSGEDPAQTRSGKVLALLNDNWKAALLIALPVVYRSLRAFLRRVREITAGGMRFLADPENVRSTRPRRIADSESDSNPKV